MIKVFGAKPAAIAAAFVTLFSLAPAHAATVPDGSTPPPAHAKDLDGRSAPGGKGASDLRADDLAKLPITPSQLKSSGAPGICMSGHSQNIGWTPWDCSGDAVGPGEWAYAGTEGQGLHLEAVAIQMWNIPGEVCIASQPLNGSWTPRNCVGSGGAIAYAGTTGSNQPLEAFYVRHTSRRVCANGHVRDIGWGSQPYCSASGEPWYVGSVGRVLEGVAATVLP